MSDLFHRCKNCNSIIWGYSYTNSKKQTFCSDCAKCYKCQKKLTDHYYNKNDGSFCCEICNLGLLIEERQSLEERAAYLEQLLEEINRREERTSSQCSNCSNPIRAGDNYYAPTKNSPVRICQICRNNEIIKANNTILGKVKYGTLKGKKIEFTPFEWSLLNDKQKNFVHEHNQRIEDQEKNQLPNKDNKSFMERNWPILLILGVIFLCAYFYSIGKNGKKVGRKKVNE